MKVKIKKYEVSVAPDRTIKQDDYWEKPQSNKVVTVNAEGPEQILNALGNLGIFRYRVNYIIPV